MEKDRYKKIKKYQFSRKKNDKKWLIVKYYMLIFHKASFFFDKKSVKSHRATYVNESVCH